ncbi:MAG: aldo/keto reductase [Leptolyngbyaceae cyanobacterium bins.59]|nr:aldo/keto reductase [Leptolyngbyaceae cyanobacterium bins.59]
MHYRRFGKTDLPLSVFSLGTMRFMSSEATAIKTVDRAVASGINHLETARGYGKSEIFLGQAIQTLGLKRDQFYVTTKSPPTRHASEMAQWIDESLERLNLAFIDCLALHGVNTAEHLTWIKSEEGCMQAVRQAVAQGKVRHVGFSTHGPLDLILATIETGFFEFVNLHYYYFFQRHAPAVALAHERDLGIFIISPADKGGMLYTPPTRLRDLCQPFTPLELTYRFLLSDPHVTTLSVGPATPEELDPALQVSDRTDPLTDAERTVLQSLHEQEKTALGTDLCSQCYQCLPCPVQINIPEVLRLRNLAIAYEMTEFSQYRYRMFENAGHWFPGVKGNRCTECGDCLPRCPEHLAIPDLLRDSHQRLGGQEGRRLWES